MLYVVDAVARQWVEKAKAAAQPVSKNAAAGTFASGVQLIRDVLPVLMTNLVQSAPDNQKEKIAKLLDIWQRGQTFPSDMLATFKHLLHGGQNSRPHSTFAVVGIANPRWFQTSSPYPRRLLPPTFMV